MIAAATRSTFLRSLLPKTENLWDLGARLLITLVVAVVVQRLLSLLFGRVERWMVRASQGGPQAEQRAKTLGRIFRNLGGTVIWGIAILRALELFGWDVRPLLAGAGILGVALGFGAQTLMRDVIAGFFILAEDQFSVGELIEVNGQPATVEDIRMRRTVLRDFNGYIHFVPNGEMKIVTNRSRGWNRLAVDALVAANEDLGQALEICRRVVSTMNADPQWKSRLLEPIELWGVESLVGPEVQVRMVLRARPGPDGPEAARELRRRVQLALADAKIRTRSGREITIMAGPQAADPTLQPS